MKTNGKKVSAETFVKVWQEADSGLAAAQKLGMPYGTMMARAGYYRGRGIKLKYFGRGANPLDVAALNKLCK